MTHPKIVSTANAQLTVNRTGTHNQTRVRLRLDIVLLHKLHQRLLARPDIRMEQDLVDDRLDLRVLQEDLEIVDLEVGDSDGFDESVCLEFLHFRPGSGDVAFGETGVVDQEEVEILQAELEIRWRWGEVSWHRMKRRQRDAVG